MITINNREISKKHSPYLIGEISANHNGSIENAKKLIEISAKCHLDAVKLQTYTPDTITLNSRTDDFLIKEGKWKGQYLYDLYKDAHLPFEWHKELFDYAEEKNITIFSSVFDESSVDFLEDLRSPAYKIASFEAIDLNLIAYVARTLKPMIISTGMANKQEIKEAVNCARMNGCEDLAILHCVSGYPTPLEDCNLNTIKDMQESFDAEVGLSDHTLDHWASMSSVALGASIIEKHITLDRNAGGPDDSFSLEPSDIQAWRNGVDNIFKSLGTEEYSLKSSEKDNSIFRRSLYYIKDLNAGDVLKESDIRSVRPGFGLPPKKMEEILGKEVKKSIKKNTPVKQSDFK